VNKIELIQALKDPDNRSKSEAETVVNLFFNKMADALAKGDRVEIRKTSKMCHYFLPRPYGQTENIALD
jgi:integration host factor subunit beta